MSAWWRWLVGPRRFWPARDPHYVERARLAREMAREM